MNRHRHQCGRPLHRVPRTCGDEPFSSLSLDDNLDAYWTLKGKRLTRAYGCFYGLEVPGELLDDAELDGPYLEWLFRYAGSSGYVLSSGAGNATVQPERT